MPLPVLGAAMAVGDISRHRDWLLEAPRPLEIQDFIFSGVLDGDWRTLADIALKKLDGHEGPLGIHGPFWDLSLSATDPLIREVVRKRFLQALDVCAHLGADLMVVHSPFSDWHEQNGFMFGGDADVIEDALVTMGPVAERARELGVTLAVENIEERFAERRLALVEALGRDVAGVSLDTGHAHYAHAKGGRPVDAHARTAGEALVHVHLQDADGYADRHWAPGLGTILWKPLFETLAESCPNARLILELRDHSTIPQGARHLVDLGLAV
jgi:sugar phosphate isomerase/epimerase